MFPRGFFPGGYFAPAYFPPVSDSTPVPTGHPPRGRVQFITRRPPDPDFIDDDEFFVMLT